MANLDRRVSYSSLPKLEKDGAKFHYEDDSLWAMPQNRNITTTSRPSSSTSSKQDHSYQFSPEPDDDFLDGGGYDSSKDPCDSVQDLNNMPPEVNVKNVVSGIFAILTGRNNVPSLTANQQLPSSNVSFLGSGKNGDTYLHSSVYIPSAPPLVGPVGLIVVLTKRCWRPILLSGFQIVLLHFACSVLLHSQQSLVADIIVGFVEGFSAEHARKGGACYLLSSGRRIRRGSAMPATIGSILYRVFLLTP